MADCFWDPAVGLAGVLGLGLWLSGLGENSLALAYLSPLASNTAAAYPNQTPKKHATLR